MFCLGVFVPELADTGVGMVRIKSIITIVTISLVALLLPLASPAKVNAVLVGDVARTVTTGFAASCGGGFLGFPAWYEGLTDGDCNVNPPSGDDGLKKFIMILGLNIIHIGLMAVAYITIGYVLFGGLKFITAEGEAEKMVGARRTIINALIGLIISLCSVAMVTFIAEGIGDASSNDWGIFTMTSDNIVKGVLNIFYAISGIIAVIVIVISGYYFVMSGDNQTSVAKARYMIQYAAIGLVVIAGAFIVTNFVLGRF